ncbi:extracellular solute-binding protein [Streptacidiphilus fuscans]|uniref:Extracellular solute-binding protein n=1 Tax=Streptacidiphilus fuscans TaxID=2789292 RepID=A0A931B8R2_9ACTN|nr:extracellular solute-binding protein [Streptacidiphilus fuscans]MBF9072206.1 extracellular solute-binding protein [Streptacidiphilus fuscans]MBF9073017.1 extracellular solute-binding protein [Streptacidiphilus fuscans]
MALSACSSSSGSSGSSGGSTTINLLAADYGTAGTSNSTQTYWQTLADAFHKAHPDITVHVQTIAWTNWAQVATMIQDKQYPDILEGDAPQQFAADGLLYPLTDVMSSSTISNLIPVFAKQEDGTDGVAYGAPFTTSARGLFYNKKLFAAAKIATPPQTWTDIQNDAAKIKALGGGNIGYGLPLGPEEAQGESYLWMLGNGGGYVDSSGKYDINSAANIQTFQFMNQLVKAGDTEPGPASTNRQQMWDAFSAGQVGMVGGSGALLPDIVKTGKLTTADYGVVPMPGKTAPLTQTLGVHDDVVAFKQGGHAAQIKEFLDYVYSDANQISFDKEYDLLPATTSASATLSGQDPVAAGFLKNVPNSVVYPSNTNWNTVLAKLKQTLGTAASDNAASVLNGLQNFATSNQ